MKKLLFILFLGITLVACSNEEPSQEASATNDEEESKIEEDSSYQSETDYTETETETEEVEQSIEYTPREEMIIAITALIDSGEAFDTGSYVKGDIPKGDYAFVTFEGSGHYFSEEDSAGNIIDNENFDSFGYVKVHEAGNVTADGVLVKVESLKQLEVSGAKELYEILNETENYTESGWYKVGTDLDPGEYVIESYGEGYVAVMSGPVGNSDIVDNENFNGRYSVNVKEGQYLVISKGAISK
ncbi:hypothetical protein [Virgibacillus sp. MG-45]|uniref:hypothetical protein n=1 Tax=Virgibacillus sp. MG-45 TaxID=3102791 RepID=UPI002ED8FCF7